MLSQDRQCVYNITLWCVRITGVAVEMQQCILCLFILFHKPHYFLEKIIGQKMCFDFLYNFFV
jgi:hypothetical protein